ncbi:nitrogenase [Planktothrix agardhii 1033]|nr:nitrogenase [Planktothrix agardhii 1033]
MTSTSQISYTREQSLAWMRGLLTMAWADGNFDEEEHQLIDALIHDELVAVTDVDSLEPISPQELGAILGTNPKLAENFLRTAVMVALADGIYSICEDDLLHQFCQALNLKIEAVPVKHWLDDLEIHDSKVAHAVCKLIPPQCPFERDLIIFGRKIVHIPPMCKLNPLYEQFTGLRFRALCYLADECHEDISKYC